MVGAFPTAEQAAIRERLARMLRFLICQRLVPRQQDGRRVAVFEILKSDSQALDGLLSGNEVSRENLDDLDAEIERLVRAGVVSPEIALAHAVDPRELAKRLGGRTEP